MGYILTERMETQPPATIEAYIAGFPEEVRARLEGARRVIASAAPGAVEAISYRMPTFKLNGKNLIHFAAFKNHIGLYPLPEALKAFARELEAYPSGKGSVQFPHDKPVPYDLIKKITEWRVREATERRP